MEPTAVNLTIEAVITLVNALNLFATATRGALPTGQGITCEIGPSAPDAVDLNKDVIVPIDLTINAKHKNLRTLSEAMNTIHRAMPRMREYPSGAGFEIVDIRNGTLPQIIGRENDNAWIMASSLQIMTYLTEGIT